MDILNFTNYWLHVVTTDIMETNSVVVNVVEDCKTKFISLTVVRLGYAIPGNQNKRNKFYPEVHFQWFILGPFIFKMVKLKKRPAIIPGVSYLGSCL